MTHSQPYIYTISNSFLPEDKQIVEVIHAHIMDHSRFPALEFRDDKKRLIALHHLKPGHTVTYTDQDGYAPNELP